MGEHLFNTQKVIGSIPITPTKYGETEHRWAQLTVNQPSETVMVRLHLSPPHTIQVKNIVIAYTL